MMAAKRKSLPAPKKLNPGAKVAILSPSLAGPAFGPAVHEQALYRLVSDLDISPVEYPTTRKQESLPEEKAADLNAAFADPEIKAIMATIGGYTLIEVLPYLDFALIKANPKIFLGYSDNTNLHNFFFHAGFQSYYGCSTMVHIGAGPALDEIHRQYLRWVLFEGGQRLLTIPSESEDHGQHWEDESALSEYGLRTPLPKPIWAGAAKKAVGISWGGCLEVLDQLAIADLLPDNEELAGTILLLETANPQISETQLFKWLRAYGERGLLEAASGVMFAHSPTLDFGYTLPETERLDLQQRRAEIVIETVTKYNHQIPICYGYPFGHTRPQIILPHGGEIAMDGTSKQIWADFG